MQIFRSGTQDELMAAKQQSVWMSQQESRRGQPSVTDEPPPSFPLRSQLVIRTKLPALSVHA